MALTLSSAKLIAQIISTLTNPLDLTTPSDALDQKYEFLFSNGTGANQANQVFHDQRTLAASATEDLDLAGVLTNAFGQTITFTKIKAIVIKAASGNTNNVRVTRPATNGVVLFLAAGDGLDVPPGGVFMVVAPDATGIAVTATTGDLITITNSAGGTSVTYDVFILGVA